VLAQQLSHVPVHSADQRNKQPPHSNPHPSTSAAGSVHPVLLAGSVHPVVLAQRLRHLPGGAHAHREGRKVARHQLGGLAAVWCDGGPALQDVAVLVALIAVLELLGLRQQCAAVCSRTTSNTSEISRRLTCQNASMERHLAQKRAGFVHENITRGTGCYIYSKQ
jgi:hypothetical protein